MRILIVSDAWEPQINGVVRTYQNIIRELHAKGHDVRVLGPDMFFNMPMPGYNEIRLSLFPNRKLIKTIEDFQPEAIHIPVEGPLGWAARRYCMKHGLPFTTSFHTMFPDYVAVRAKKLGSRAASSIRNKAISYVRRFHAPAKGTFVATQSIEDQLKAWQFKEPMVRLLRGVNFDVFYPGPRTLFNDLPKPIQLYVGRVSSEKNIEAFLNLSNPGTKIVVGDGPALDSLKRKYKDAVFTGVQQGKDLADHFRSADVFVFPSKSDTFGIVLIEALACGVPIAGYDVPGPRDIVTEPVLGAIDSDLGQAVTKALSAPGTAQERSQHAHTHYSWHAVADTFLKTQQMRPS